MGLIGKISGFFRTERGGDKLSEVKANVGPSSLVTCPHFEDAGSESHPLDSDLAITVDLPNSWGHAVVGYSDVVNSKITNPGEKRIYARNAIGDIVSSFYLKNDGSGIWSNGVVEFELKANGSATIANSAGSFEMESGGDVVINGVTITKLGDVKSATGVSLNNHPHSQPNDGGGDTEQPTLAPTPTP